MLATIGGRSRRRIGAGGHRGLRPQPGLARRRAGRRARRRRRRGARRRPPRRRLPGDPRARLDPAEALRPSWTRSARAPLEAITTGVSPPPGVRPVPLRPVNRLRFVDRLRRRALVVAASATAATSATTATATTTTTVASRLDDDHDAAAAARAAGRPADNRLEPQTFYGRIQIPAIEVDSPLLEGIRINTLDYGPGHWPGRRCRRARQRRRRRPPHEPQRRLPSPRRAEARRPGDLRPRCQPTGLRRIDGVEVTVPTPDELHRQVRLRRPLRGDRHAGLDVGGQPGLPPLGDAVRLPPAGLGVERIVVIPRPRRPRDAGASRPTARRRRHRRSHRLDDTLAGARRASPGGLFVALALPPWGWWPLRVHRHRRLRTRRRRASGRRRRFLLGFVFAFAWLATGMAWMWS